MDSTHACHHHAAAPPDEARVADLISRAEQMAVSVGEKWTASRARVYELLLRATAPVKAYDLIPAYADNRLAKPPTVYRALDFLENLGLVHRIPSLTAYTACRGGAPSHTASFLICQCCGSAEEIFPDLGRLVSRAGGQNGFSAMTATLEIRGLCEHCRH
jgi:Fur family transcriptional regulator, zinc uptake regulator